MQHKSKTSSCAENVHFFQKKRKGKNNRNCMTSHSFSYCEHCSQRFFLQLQREKLPLRTSTLKVTVFLHQPRPLLLISLFLVTSKLQKLRGKVKKNNFGQKKKVIRLPTSSSSSGDSVFQALNGCFSLQHCWIMLHFCSKHI